MARSMGPEGWQTHNNVEFCRKGRTFLQIIFNWMQILDASSIWLSGTKLDMTSLELMLWIVVARQNIKWMSFSHYKWNESGFRPPLCTYRLNWARRTSWGWWDDWDDTVLQTHDSKFKPWRSEAEHTTSRSRRLPTILTFTRGWGRNIFSFFQTAETGNRTPDSGVNGSCANHYPRAPAL